MEPARHEAWVCRIYQFEAEILQDAYNGVASLYSTVSGFFLFLFSQLGEGKTYWTLFIYFILFLNFLLWETVCK